MNVLTLVASVSLLSLVAAPAVAAPPVEPENKITIDVMDADVINIIRLIADVSGKNVVVADDVKGKITVKLRNVGWRTALKVILKSSGSGVVEEDNILWVAPQARIDADELHALDLAAERELKGPLFTRIVQVNNANAKELAVVVKGLLSPRGTLVVDERTNTIIVRDIKGSPALRP